MERTYTKIGLIDGKVVILRNAKQIPFLGEEAIVGTHINKYGDEIVSGKATERTQIIQTTLIKSKTEMVMNNFYGELEKK